MFMLPTTSTRRTPVVYHIVFLPSSILILLAIQSAQRRPCYRKIFDTERLCLSARGVEGEEEILWAEYAEFVQDQLVGGEDVGDVEERVGMVDVGAVRWWGPASRFCCFRGAGKGLCAEGGDGTEVELGV